MMESSRTKQTLFISHGGGPLPLFADSGHTEMVGNLEKIALELVKPSAILLISAHWEEKRPTVTGNASPSLLYDYSGFPAESYQITYPAKGAPGLAQSVVSILGDNGIETIVDDARGFDHGMFIPLKIMYPQADIPCVQLSLARGLDPALHIAIGEGLSTLDQEKLLIIGSGFSFHNMREFFSPQTAQKRLMNELFEDWLVETCSSPALEESQRTERLTNWQEAPHARYCHPREEHLLPLHVCYGVNKRACSKYYRLTILGVKASVYIW